MGVKSGPEDSKVSSICSKEKTSASTWEMNGDLKTGHKNSIQEIIASKRDGGVLSEQDIATWVEELVAGGVAGEQLGAWLMAVYVRGLNLQETSCLTRAMVQSGITLSWPKAWTNSLVDKHSTGGVGDKVSLPLAPALAACGLKVPMISGRGLGITGGTLDKLESIPGYRVQLSLKEITRLMEEVGCCIAGQTGEICPADKIMYAARDISETVGCLGLITSSIISKKAAEGVRCLVLDIKWGSGCCQASLEDAEAMANALLQTSRALGVKTSAVISHMQSPLGLTVGNSLEVEESLACLRGGGPPDLRELVVTEGGVFPRASTITPLMSEHGGWVRGADAKAVGLLSQGLGAGRSLPDDVLDLSAGVEMLVGPGERVEKGQVWARVHHSRPIPDHLLQAVIKSLDVAPDKIEPAPRISDVLMEA